MKKTMILIMFFSVYTVYAEDTNKYLDPSLGGWFFNTYDQKKTHPPEKNYPERRRESNKYQHAEELIKESIPNEIVRQQQMQLEFIQKQKEKEKEVIETTQENDTFSEENLNNEGHWLNTK